MMYSSVPEARCSTDSEDALTSASLPAAGSTVIVVMGQTGSGKSTFIKTATGNADIVVGHDLKSCTQGVMWYQVPNTDVFLVDTPGFDDSCKDDLTILRTIAQMFEDFFENSICTRGVIYMHDILEPRMKRSALKNMRMFEEIVGAGNMASCCLVTSKWGLQDAAKSIKNETELIATRDFWGLFRKRGAKVARFTDTPESAAAIWHPLSNRASYTTQITEEYSIKDQPIATTSAGKLVDQNLDQATKEHAEEIARLKRDVMRASQRQDYELTLELDEERQRLQVELEKLREDQRALEEERKKENERFHATFDAMKQEHAESLANSLAVEREEARARRARRRNRRGRWIARGTGLMFALCLPVSTSAFIVGASAIAGVEALCHLHKSQEEDDYGDKGL